MKEKIDKLVNEVRKNFSIINKTLKEMEESFVFKGFEDNLPTVEQYSDGYSIYLLDENETELPVEYIFDGFCLDDGTCYPIPISVCGLNEEDINEIKQNIENDSYFDTNGYELDDTIIGVEIIGNVTDNPD